MSKLLRYFIALICAVFLWVWYYNGLPVPSLKGNGRFINIIEKKTQLPFPDIDDSWLTGQNVSNQWEGSVGLYAVTAINDLPVYKTPSFSSSIITKLHTARRVRAIYRYPKAVSHNDETGHWTFITTEDGNYTIGWVFDHYLAYTSKFTKVTDWETHGFSLIKGDYFAQYTVSDTGRYSCRWKASGNGLLMNGTHKGQLYRFLDLIWAKKDNPDIWQDFFFINKEDNMQIEWKFRNSSFEAHKNTPAPDD
ncbi:MAG: hypothetical protein GY730_09490 [bacterium]|nr:hypothetical protein [bacterium]